MKAKIISGCELDISTLQGKTIERLFELLIENQIRDLLINNYWYKGLRGNDIDKPNLCIHFTFNYYEFNFEFFFSYDQIEYYISIREKKIAKVSIEDFWNYETMIDLFFKNLMTDMEKNKIPFNLTNLE